MDRTPQKAGDARRNAPSEPQPLSTFGTRDCGRHFGVEYVWKIERLYLISSSGHIADPISPRPSELTPRTSMRNGPQDLLTE